MWGEERKKKSEKRWMVGDFIGIGRIWKVNRVNREILPSKKSAHHYTYLGPIASTVNPLFKPEHQLVWIAY